MFRVLRGSIDRPDYTALAFTAKFNSLQIPGRVAILQFNLLDSYRLYFLIERLCNMYLCLLFTSLVSSIVANCSAI